jgi:hypothetical protein
VLDRKRADEINELTKDILERNKQLSKDQIEFTQYCERKMQQRAIEKDLVFSTLLSKERPYYAEIQKVPFREGTEIRHKLIYKISTRYSLIVVVVYSKSVLKIVNVIKTSKGAEKLWRKKVLK